MKSVKLSVLALLLAGVCGSALALPNITLLPPAVLSLAAATRPPSPTTPQVNWALKHWLMPCRS